ncbi:kinase-like domain-containing protein, partial [Sordaria brevicollis]
KDYCNYFVSFFGWFTFTRGSLTYVYIIMEYLREGSLYKYLEDNGALDETSCRQVVHQILQGLAIMHRAGIAHRDLKPQNILISQLPSPGVFELGWQIKLADFGITRTIESRNGYSSVKVTVAYQAPEVDVGGYYPRSYGLTDFFRVDMWALATTAYQLLCTEMPFQSHSIKSEFVARGPCYNAITQRYQTTLAARHPEGIKPEAYQFISELFTVAENRKLTQDCLQHAWFQEKPMILDTDTRME